MNTAFAMTIALVAMALPGVTLASPAPDQYTFPGSAASTHAPMTIHGNGGDMPEFHDEHGQAISEDAFMTASKRGQRFTMKPDKNSGTIVMKLLPVGVNTPGSHSLSAATKKMSQNPKPGTTFPPVVLPRVGSGMFPGASAHGKPLLVDFFFADCVGCIEELPVLNAYASQHPEQEVLAITYDDASTAEDFVKQRHFAWPVAYSGGDFITDLGVKAFPTMVVVGADGKVLATRMGARLGMTAKDLDQWVTESLAKAEH